jgi:hypothetical protein
MVQRVPQGKILVSEVKLLDRSCNMLILLLGPNLVGVSMYINIIDRSDHARPRPHCRKKQHHPYSFHNQTSIL